MNPRSPHVLIRAETERDCPGITELNRIAFGRQEEATLIERLRSDGLLIASLVAVNGDGQLLGHIFFSRATIVTGSDELQVASLAPMAVLPSHQRRGIGSKLVECGVETCRSAEYSALIVVGHPNYYPRFGFSHVLVARLKNPFSMGDAFMGLELVRGSLYGLAGQVVYPDAFSQL